MATTASTERRSGPVGDPKLIVLVAAYLLAHFEAAAGVEGGDA